MRFTFYLLPLLLTVNSAWSQNQATPALTATAAATASQAHHVQPRSEHTRVEDADARIDEQRVGGVTQHILVQPKGAMPGYQVSPQTGERSWKVLGF